MATKVGLDNSALAQAKQQSDNSVAARQSGLAAATGDGIVATPTNSDFPVAMDRARELARVPPMNGPQPIVNSTSKGSL